MNVRAVARTLLPLAPLALCLSACGDKAEDDTAGTWSPESFEGGSFQFTTTSAEDVCFDGAFAALFLPDGDGSTQDWDYPIELPSWSGLPATYDIQLQEPFSTMNVTVSAGSSVGNLSIDGARQEDVYLDQEGEYPDCQVDMDIVVELTIDGPDTAHGSAVLTLENVPTDTCPETFADPCTMTLDFDAVRK